MLPNPNKPRRPLAFHVYAALCALTGFSGLALSLWVHPLDRAALMAVQAEAKPPALTARAAQYQPPSGPAYGPDHGPAHATASGPLIIPAEYRGPRIDRAGPL